MQRKIFYSFIVLSFIVILTGCRKENKEVDLDKILDYTFKITCTDELTNMGNMTTQNENTYYFNSEQYNIGYSTKTTQKFNYNNAYNEYKKAQEETINAVSSGDRISYTLKTDDAEKTLVFTMSVKDIDIFDSITEEEKENLKAINILNKKEKSNSTCIITGIERDELQ